MFFKKKQKPDNDRKTVLRITGMHCTSCGMTIDDALEEVPGVRSSKTNYAKARTEVQHTDAIKLEQLIAAVQEAGYQAEVA